MKYDNHIPDITRILAGSLETNCLIIFCREYVAAFKFLKVYFERLYADNIALGVQNLSEEERYLTMLIDNYTDLNRAIVNVTKDFVELDENITCFFNQRTVEEHTQIYPAIEFLKKKSLYYRSASLNPDLPPCDFHTLYLAILNYWHDEKYRLSFLSLVEKTGRHLRIEEFPIDPRTFTLYDLNIFPVNYALPVSKPRSDFPTPPPPTSHPKTLDEALFEQTQKSVQEPFPPPGATENRLLDFVSDVLKQHTNINLADIVKNTDHERALVLQRIHEIEPVPDQLLVLEASTGRRYLLGDFRNFDHAFDFWLNVQMTQHLFDLDHQLLK